MEPRRPHADLQNKCEQNRSEHNKSEHNKSEHNKSEKHKSEQNLEIKGKTKQILENLEEINEKIENNYRNGEEEKKQENNKSESLKPSIP
jgi:predicted  nucleic acid-binding Zn-ribbon protein